MSRQRRNWLLVIATLSVTAGGVSLWFYSQRGWTVSKLERLIQLELPADCNRRQIELWFDHHGIAHDYFADTTGHRRGRETMPRLAGLRSEDLSGMVRGSIEGPEANVSLIVSGRIMVFFFLDMQGRRVGHWIDPFAYMP